MSLAFCILYLVVGAGGKDWLQSKSCKVVCQFQCDTVFCVIIQSMCHTMLCNILQSFAVSRPVYQSKVLLSVEYGVHIFLKVRFQKPHHGEHPEMFCSVGPIIGYLIGHVHDEQHLDCSRISIQQRALTCELDVPTDTNHWNVSNFYFFATFFR